MSQHVDEASVAPAAGAWEKVAPFFEGLDIYGVRLGLGAPQRDHLDRMLALLPPGVPRCEPSPDDPWFLLLEAGDHMWSYRGPNGPSATFADLALVVAMIDTELRRFLADNAADGFRFIHAGVVGYRGHAIVIPGDSFSGKTTLVAELVRAGAEYYSDEFAVLDDQGLVHPFARPLSIRRPGPGENDSSPVESIGGTTGVEPLPVGVIAQTSYLPSASFQPQRRSGGHGMLALLAHSAGAHEHPQETLAAARQAASAALVLEGDRGEAADAARLLIELASGAGANGASARG